MATSSGASRFRLRWDAQGLSLEERQADGGYALRADSGLKVPPTPMAATHPEMKALVKRALDTFRESWLGEDDSLDLSLAPPWGSAWLIETDDLPDEEIEEQVAWELQQRLDSPLDDFIYAWHPFGREVYAIVIRPELVDFWEDLAEQTGVELGSITLRAGLVSSDVEQSADLLPLYRLWVERRGGTPRRAKPVEASAASSSEDELELPAEDALDESFDDDELLAEEALLDEGFEELAEPQGEEHEEGFRLVDDSFDPEDEGYGEDEDAWEGPDAVDPDELSDEGGDEALEAILGGGKKKRRRRIIVAAAALLLLVSAVAATGLFRDRLPSDLRVQLGAWKNRALALVQRAADALVPDGGAEPDQLADSSLAQAEPSRTQPEEDRPSSSEAMTARREVDEPQRTASPRPDASTQQQAPSEPEPEPIVAPAPPTAGNAMAAIYLLADHHGVKLRSAVLQGQQLLVEVSGRSSAVDAWQRDLEEVPGQRTHEPGDAAPLRQGRLVRIELALNSEQQMTEEQFNQLAESIGARAYGKHAWRSDRTTLERLLKDLGQGSRRPFRLSVHNPDEATFLLAMLP